MISRESTDQISNFHARQSGLSLMFAEFRGAPVRFPRSKYAPADAKALACRNIGEGPNRQHFKD